MRPPRKYRRNKAARPVEARRYTGEISHIGHLGDGVAIVDDQAVHVPYTAPGDKVALEVRGTKGEVTDLISPGPDRAEPVCRHFGPSGDRCGGCAMQHLDASAVEAWQRALISDALARAGVDGVTVRPVVRSPLQSRRRAGFHLRRIGGQPVAGFKARASHTLVPLQECHILHPDIVAARTLLEELTAPLFALKPDVWFTCFVTRCDNGLDIDIGGGVAEADLTLSVREALAELVRVHDIARLTLNRVPISAPRQPVIRLGDISVALPPKGFLQATAEGEQALQRLVLAGLGSARRVADLFAGAGTFTLCQPPERRVLAVESDREAIGALAQAVRVHGGQSVSTEIRDLVHRPLQPGDLKGFEAVIIDPPRAGAEAQMQALAASTVPVVVSVSCNPVTFARDARILVDGGYMLRDVTPVDQFRFSSHIEVVGTFRRS